MERKVLRYYLSIGLLLILHAVGVLSLKVWDWPVWREVVLALTPVNLMITLGIVLLAHEKWDKKVILGMALVAFGGWLLEVMGVHTGIIFGEYTYGPTLGPGLFNVPLAMMVNWLLLVYASAAFMEPFELPAWFKVVGAAAIMVLLDFVIEPVAMQLDFWQWEGDIIPITNYIAWFVASIGFHALFRFLGGPRNNKVGVAALFIQALFFLCLYL